MLGISNAAKEVQTAIKCAYSYVFETRNLDNTSIQFADAPHPFIMEPPLDGRTVFEPGQELDFDLIVIGKGIDYLPYFVLAFRELGKIGIGKRRGRFRLALITAINPLTNQTGLVYNGQENIVHNPRLQVSFDDVLAVSDLLSPEAVTLRFLTPTRLKHDGTYVSRPLFEILLRSVLRRISALCHFHCGEDLNLDYTSLIERSRQIQASAMETAWVDWERFSSRQDTKMKLGGFIGWASYQGELAPFLPFLILGELLHVGKACTFGNGKYVLHRQSQPIRH